MGKISAIPEEIWKFLSKIPTKLEEWLKAYQRCAFENLGMQFSLQRK
jgi:hypothetical protein